MKKTKDILDLLNPDEPEVRKILLTDLFWDEDAVRNTKNPPRVTKAGQAVRLGVYEGCPKNTAAVARTTRQTERSAGRNLRILEKQKVIARHPDNPTLWILGEEAELDRIKARYAALLQG